MSDTQAGTMLNDPSVRKLIYQELTDLYGKLAQLGCRPVRQIELSIVQEEDSSSLAFALSRSEPEDGVTEIRLSPVPA